MTERIMKVLLFILVLGGMALAVILFSIYLGSVQVPEVILSDGASLPGIIIAAFILLYIVRGELHPKYLFRKKDE